MKKVLLTAGLSLSLLLANVPMASAAEIKGLLLDDQALSLEQYAVFQEEEQVIVPLRPTAEALGFTVVWDDARNVIMLDNQRVKTQLTIGKDSYYKQSSKAIGLTQPIQLGYAPTIIDGRTYVPLGLFELLLGKGQVQEADGWITITTTPQNAQLPNPVVEYPSIEDAQAACGFTFLTPQLPEGYAFEQAAVIAQDTVSLRYSKDGQTLTFRASQREGDISGVYTTYAQTGELANAQVKGDASLATLHVALCRADGVTYSIYSEAGLSRDDMAAALKSLQPQPSVQQ